MNVQSGELRRSGVLLHLSPQPFRLLVLLASRSGELVTRDEIRDQIWGRDTYVDFEHGLNFAVNKVREALGDNRENPRYIETLPRRGYRFIAPVLSETQSASSEPAHHRRWRWILATGLAAIVVAAAISTVRLRQTFAAPLKIESIAVLPFENLSGDSGQDYVAAGLSDALITDLGEIAGLRVISRTSVIQFSRNRKALPEIARELGIDAALEGAIRRSGSRLLVTAQLLDARADRHLWAASYDREARDSLMLEKQIAVTIAHEVSGRLSLAEQMRLAHTSTSNRTAYEACVRGRYLLDQRINESIAAATGHFEEAVRADPRYALAWSGLSDCYVTGWRSVTTKKDYALAEQYARRAVALDPDLAEAHASLGRVHYCRLEFTSAEAEFRRAIELNPNYAMAHHWWALQLLGFGQLNEALAANGRARQVDPFSFPVCFARVMILTAMHEYERAQAEIQTLSSIAPGASEPDSLLAGVYWMQNRLREAIAAERRYALATHSPAWVADLDRVAAELSTNGTGAARIAYARLKERGYDRKIYTASDVASAYALAGDQDKALRWLNRLLADDGDNELPVELSAPQFDGLRSLAAFHDLRRRLRLE